MLTQTNVLRNGLAVEATTTRFGGYLRNGRPLLVAAVAALGMPTAARAAPSMHVDYQHFDLPQERIVINNHDTIRLDDTEIGDQVIFEFLIRDFGDQPLSVNIVEAFELTDNVADAQGNFFPVLSDFPASVLFEVTAPGLAQVGVFIHSNDATQASFNFTLVTFGVVADLVVTKDEAVLSEEAPIERSHRRLRRL